MIEDGLQEYLVGSDPNVAAFKALVSTRVYPVLKVPQAATTPYVTFQRISTLRGHSLTQADGLPGARVQLNCYGGTGATAYGTAKNVANKLRLALDGFRGAMGSYTVQAALLEDERDLPNDPANATERGSQAVTMDVVIWFEETVTAFI